MIKLLKSLAVLALLPSTIMASNTQAVAADVIGLSLPMNKRYTEVSKRVEFGALLAKDNLNKIDKDVDVKLVDDKCDINTATELYEQLSDARAVIGLPCFKVAVELARDFKTANKDTPVFTFRTRNPALKRLREVEKLSIIEFSNTPNAEAKAVVDFILPQFGTKPYAILDDGSVYGRGLADSIRLLAEETGRKPIISTNFRPLQTNQKAVLRRLQRSGAEAVFVAAEAEDVVTIAKDLSDLKLNWPLGTGEQMALLPFVAGANQLKTSIFAVAPNLGSIEDSKFLQAVDELQNSADPEIVLGYVMMEVALQYISSPERKTFATILGEVELGLDSRIVLEPFQLQQWTNGKLNVIESN